MESVAIALAYIATVGALLFVLGWMWRSEGRRHRELLKAEREQRICELETSLGLGQEGER